MWIEYELETAGGHIDTGCVNSEKLKWFGCRNEFKFHIEYDDETCDWFAFDYQEDVENVISAFKKAIMGQEDLIDGIGFIRPLRRIFNDETTLIPSAYQGEELPGASCCSVHAGGTEECKD